MNLRGVKYEDIIQYKETSLFLIMPYCSFKCDKESNTNVCQNSSLSNSPIIFIEDDELIREYLSNSLTKAIVFGGLEPFDSFDEMYSFIDKFRNLYKCNDTVVIYTGYNKTEIEDKIEILKNYPNIIIKFGRFVPEQDKHFDDTLGVYLASDNQYAEIIS